jgi:hypothetical protein
MWYPGWDLKAEKGKWQWMKSKWNMPS